ncbi:PR domain zinc finger protein 1-like [Homarus americanus]|uniref:PR domain zinc finger protein 1-like n=1 Tax=Homarus americanus TaxID=6706 RepID=A0A8J5MTH2_HOMAM|nr:PR domain zinc finger protein 1-like [Homarus americanus]
MPAKMGEEWDLDSIKEEEWEERAVYLVPDTPTEESCPNHATLSLPRNLVLKASQTISDVMGIWSTDYIPRGTRFGPLVGKCYAKDQVPKTANRKYFWRVYRGDELYYYIDGYDTTKANWMRYVNPAYSSEAQNLIACQYKSNIYFYTIKPILPNQELLVWYCREFATRLNYPLTGEQMLLKIRQQVGDSDVKEEPEAVPSKSSTTPPAASTTTGSLPVASPTQFETRNGQLTPTEGSVRSDEGYDSNGYHHDFNMPEDSSDSEGDNNYVLDFSKKKRKEFPTEEEEVELRNEYRKVKIKMSRAYHYRSKSTGSDTSEKEKSVSPPLERQQAAAEPPMTPLPETLPQPLLQQHPQQPLPQAAPRPSPTPAHPAKRKGPESSPSRRSPPYLPPTHYTTFSEQTPRVDSVMEKEQRPESTQNQTARRYPLPDQPLHPAHEVPRPTEVSRPVDMPRPTDMPRPDTRNAPVFPDSRMPVLPDTALPGITITKQHVSPDTRQPPMPDTRMGLPPVVRLPLPHDSRLAQGRLPLPPMTRLPGLPPNVTTMPPRLPVMPPQDPRITVAPDPRLPMPPDTRHSVQPDTRHPGPQDTRHPLSADTRLSVPPDTQMVSPRPSGSILENILLRRLGGKDEADTTQSAVTSHRDLKEPVHIAVPSDAHYKPDSATSSSGPSQDFSYKRSYCNSDSSQQISPDSSSTHQKPGSACYTSSHPQPQVSYAIQPPVSNSSYRTPVTQMFSSPHFNMYSYSGYNGTNTNGFPPVSQGSMPMDHRLTISIPTTASGHSPPSSNSSHSSQGTHWKTTSCKPSTPEEELAVERSPTGSSGGYDYCPSIASGSSLDTVDTCSMDGLQTSPRHDLHDSGDYDPKSPSYMIPEELIKQSQEEFKSYNQDIKCESDNRPSVIESSAQHAIECT